MTAGSGTSFDPAAAQYLRASSGVVGIDVSLPEPLVAFGWVPPRSAEAGSETQHRSTSARSDAPSVWPANALRSRGTLFESSALSPPLVAGLPWGPHGEDPR